MHIRPLIWKETRESLIYLWIGLFVFLGLPIIGAIEALFTRAHRFELLTSPWVASCGGILAVFVAVGSTCRDLVPRLMDFWQSRPVSPWVWMAVKYIVGLMVVELACILPVVVEALVTRHGDSKPALLYLPFLWFAVYSIAFLIGCLVRRTAQAAMISLVAMVLVWLLPTIVLWLRPFEITRVMRVDEMGWDQVRFTLCMSALAIVLAIAAMLVAQFNLQIRANRRLMLGTIAGACVLLLGSLSFRFGTNMPVLQTIDLQPTETVYRVALGPDNSGLLFTGTTARNVHDIGGSFYRSLLVTGDGLSVGEPIEMKNVLNFLPRPLRPRDDPYDAEADATHWYEVETPNLTAQDPLPDELDQNLMLYDTAGQHRKLLTIWRQPARWRTYLYRYGNTLFALSSSQFVAYDASDPQQPKELSRGTTVIEDGRMFANAEPRETLLLPQLPGVPAQQRLDCLLQIHSWYVARENDLVVSRTNSGFAAYRLQTLNDQAATFVRISQRLPSAASNVFGLSDDWMFHLKNGLLYTSTGRNSSSINPRCTVYDVRDDFKEIGHFAAAGAGDIYPLEDGRSIVVGTRVYLIGPPPRAR